MIFNDNTNQQGIVQAIRFLTKTNEDTFPIEDVTRETNIAMNEYFNLAMEANNQWQIDDTTYSDFSVGTVDLASGQSQYRMPTGTIDVVNIKVRDAAGQMVRLTPIDQSEVYIPFETYFTTTGTPKYYDLRSDGIFLYPSPNYNYDEGLQLEYKRKPNPILTTDTDLVPGIPETHHNFLSEYVAVRFAIKETKGATPGIKTLLDITMSKIQKYWASRNPEKKTRLGVRTVTRFK